jgi:DNA polymerase
MLVGEQPGDQEDRQGAPFVGPAGRLLRASLEEAGLAADRTYLTNVVKHFKWEPRGKRRMHKTPAASEIAVCRAWLDEEIRLVQPRFVVALGSTAAAALFGSSVRVTRDRGSLFELADGTPGTVTVHPSSILRAGSSAAREEARLAFVTDLRRIGRRAGRL